MLKRTSLLRPLALAMLVAAVGRPVFGQNPAAVWMQNAYWRDGKAEFNLYEGTVARYGQVQPAEVIHIYVREDFTPEAHVKADDWKRPDVYPVLKLNQVLRVQTGIYVYQQMHSSFWKIDGGELIKWSLTSNDSCGNTFKIADRDEPGEDWNYRYFTYWENMVEGSEQVPAPPEGVFYDELPARVRGLDFSAGEGTLFIQLAPSVIQSKKDAISFAPATVGFTTDTAAGQTTVTVWHQGGKDVLTLDAAFPHLLREWQMAAGGVLKLKQSLKLDYWNYHALGDRERALDDPALRLPR